MDQFSDHSRVAKNCARNMSIVSGSLFRHSSLWQEYRKQEWWSLGRGAEKGWSGDLHFMYTLVSLNVVPCTGTTYLKKKKQVAVEKG